MLAIRQTKERGDEMRTRLMMLFLILMTAACAQKPRPAAAPATRSDRMMTPAPPVTVARPVTETLHGVTITDQYRWLEEQTSPETRQWINDENRYTDAMTANLPDRAGIERRLMDLQQTTVTTTPVVRSGRYFYTKRGVGQDLFSIYMRQGLGGAEQLLIDPTPMSANHSTSVGIQNVTSDGHILAYDVREGGVDETTIHFLDVDAHRDLSDVLPRARYQGLSVLPNHSDVYYATHSSSVGPRVFHHVIGLTGTDPQIFGEGYMPDKIIGTRVSQDGRYLVIEVFYGSAPKKTEVYVKDLRGDNPIRTVVNDIEAKSSVDTAGDNLVITTNWDAPNSRVMVVSAADPARQNWREIVPENKGAAIQGVSAVAGSVFVRYLDNVRSRIDRFSLDGAHGPSIAFDEIGSLGDLSGQWSSNEAFFTYGSFAVPSTIYRIDTATGERSIFARQEVPVDSSQFEVKQVSYTSKDGTTIPMFLLYKKGLNLNGANPTLLTGYGGFSLSQLPRFSASAVVWAEHGGVYALPNLRGGGEFGEAWHQAGMQAKKQNVFDDFIAAAAYLVRSGYTNPSKLAIRGGSNGGLLVTAALTQRPDLFKAVIVSFPLVDMLRYQKFLVGSFWVPEYGSADDPEQFRTIYAYSPYQHVVKGTKYPATLFITGDADTRVAPLHARKMAALMQASTGSTNPVLIRYHTNSGHSGGEPLSEAVKNESEILGFLMAELGAQ
jgi:prolyl oligopeptidase